MDSSREESHSSTASHQTLCWTTGIQLWGAQSGPHSESSCQEERLPMARRPAYQMISDRGKCHQEMNRVGTWIEFVSYCCVKRRRQWHPTPVLLPGKSHGWRSLVGCSPWGCWELDMTELLHFHFSLSCFGEGNGNPLQCSCLENPRDGGTWWAAVYGVSQSRTRLKWLSSSREGREQIKQGVQFINSVSPTWS